MNFDFSTLTKEEFEGFVQDAQKLSDQAKSLEASLKEAQETLEAVKAERDALSQAKAESDRLAELTSKVASLREQADQALAKQQIDPAEFAEYFSSELAKDVIKFGNDSLELTLAERWLAKVIVRPAATVVNVRSLTMTGANSNGYQTTLTAENLAE